MVNVIKSSFDIESFDAKQMIAKIERAGRICYQSTHKIEDGSAEKFIKMIIANGHESVLEHEKITVRVVCDRGVTHEIVRHRIASYSQESTRYCNYSADRFGNQISIIDIFNAMDDCQAIKDVQTAFEVWMLAMEESEKSYIKLINLGVPPQLARGVLPNSLKTEIYITMNLREWRHFFKLRTTLKAHPQMREITIPMLKEFTRMLPCVFSDIIPE